MQKALISSDYIGFQADLNSYLKDGWRVVPGTLNTNISSAFSTERYAQVVVNYICSVVIEKEKD